MYFANPATFNDPLDCNPTLECDSDVCDLRKVFETLLRRRLSLETNNNLDSLGLKRDDYTELSNSKVDQLAREKMAMISYEATNPEYLFNRLQNEKLILLNNIETELRRNYDHGVCCFSRSYFNHVLWSHYGDQHKGLCLGYSIDQNVNSTLFKVTYDKCRSIKTSILEKAYILNDESSKNELNHKFLLRKAREWSHEREWRMIGKTGIQYSPLKLADITFGLRCPSSIQHVVISALSGRQKDLNFYEIKVDSVHSILRRNRLNLDEISAAYPQTTASLDDLPNSDFI